MFESLVADLLTSHLGDFIEGVSSSDLNISILKGTCPFLFLSLLCFVSFALVLEKWRMDEELLWCSGSECLVSLFPLGFVFCPLRKLVWWWYVPLPPLLVLVASGKSDVNKKAPSDSIPRLLSVVESNEK